MQDTYTLDLHSVKV